LLLAMLERCVADAGGSYLFCDTDSMCIVASARGGHVPCIGSKRNRDGREAIKTLSRREVMAITARFNRLNPYDRSCFRTLLKIQDIKHVNSDHEKPLRHLFGYAIAAKRYALYERSKNGISIVKASGHGLGYLYMPNESHFDEERDEDSNDDAPAWVLQ